MPDIKAPEHVIDGCLRMYTDVLTYQKRQTLERIINHAFKSGVVHEKEIDSENEDE